MVRPKFLNSKHKLELINKSYFVTARDILTEKEFLNDFNWVSYWFKKNFIEISEHLGTMIIPVLLYIFFLKKENNQNPISYKKLSFFLFFCFSQFYFLVGVFSCLSLWNSIFYKYCFYIRLLFLCEKNFSRKIFLT